MTKIYIRGILVGPDYDCDIFSHDIEVGTFCPSSRVLRAIDEANGDALEVHINSEGGDVFAFNEVANRIKSYPSEVKIIIGATAFSEAANLALMSGRPIFVHPNSLLLFHSAMTPWLENAASGELRSEAAMIDKINAPIKAALKSKGVPEDEVENGFRDGCSLVLGADELVKYGMAGLLENDNEDEKPINTNEALSLRIAALAEASQRIAAHFQSTKKVNRDMSKKQATKKTAGCDEEPKKIEAAEEEVLKEETTEEVKTEEVKEEPSTEETTTEEETKEEVVKDDDSTEENTEEEKTKEEEVASEDDKEEDPMEEVLVAVQTLTETINNLSAKNADIESRIAALEEQLTEKEVEVQEAKKALKVERAKRIGALAKAISTTSATDTAPADWPEAVKRCNGDKMAAYKKWPELAKAWAKPNN